MSSTTRTARITGLLYLGLAIAGTAGFLTIRTRLFAPGDPQTTLANLVGNESLARTGIAFELLVVLTQALTAAWFHRLFRTVAPAAAAGIAAFGLINAVAILGSAALLATATDLAHDPQGTTAADVQMLYLLSGHLWTVAGLFFGLWLIPMGVAVLRTGRMPRPLGWILVAGGVGYIVQPFATYLLPDLGTLSAALPILATIGEFWMIGYLLFKAGSTTFSGYAESTVPAR